MKLWHLFSTIWICIVFTGTPTMQCVKKTGDVGRRCRKHCVIDEDCKAPNKTCNCDGECGMSCYNMDAVCGEPDSIQHGSVTRTGIKMQNVANYSCDAGYRIRGNRTRICRADKNWHPRPPKCKKWCSRPPRIAYSYLQTLRKSFPVGASPSYRCRTGYYTDDDQTTTCLETGSWSVTRFKCRQKLCRPITPVLNGHIMYSSSFYFGSIAILRCIRGFDLQHKGRRQICASGRADLHTGTWSGLSLGECVRKPCPPPLNPRNGRFTYASLSHRNEYETEIRYSCDIGFRLDGNSSTVCDYTGSWGEQPSCFDIKCAQPPTTRLNAERNGISYAIRNLLLPESTVHYQCRQNFKMSGNRKVLHDKISTCQYREEAKTSMWNPGLDTIKCEEIFCNRPPSEPDHVMESVKQSYRVGETVTVTCREGYGFSRSTFVDTVACTDSGLWDSSFTRCQDIRCPEAPDRIQHGGRVSITFTDVTYKCDENYQVPGTNLVKKMTIKCRRYFLFRKSVWAVHLDHRRCERIPCSLPSQEWHVKSYQKRNHWWWGRNREIYQPSNNWYAGQQAFFHCTEGYEFAYTDLKYFPARCLETGRWEDWLRPCVEDVKCSVLPSIINGVPTNVPRTPFLPGSVASYRCRDGYRISLRNYHSSTLDITCRKNAERLGSRWDPIPTQIRCQEIRCNRPPHHVYHELITDNKQSWRISETVKARCKYGYEFSRDNFVDKIKCTSSGRWDSSFTQCQEIRCNRPPHHDDHELITNNNKQSWRINEMVKARCKHGYKFPRDNFIDTVTCTSSGTWDPSFTPCQEIRCDRPQHDDDHELITNNKESWRMNETVKARCKHGYEFPDNFIDTVICTSSESWDTSFTPCQAEYSGDYPPTSSHDGVNDQRDDSRTDHFVTEDHSKSRCTAPNIAAANQRILERRTDGWDVNSVITVECLENFRYGNFMHTRDYTCGDNNEWNPTNIEPCVSMSHPRSPPPPPEEPQG